MNIEELELSLRTEFEGQMKNVLAGIKQEVTEFQRKFEAEFEKHRSELDRTISDLSDRIPESADVDPAFEQSLNEHLRLARDEGAQIAATAFGEAEKLRVETENVAPASYDLIRNAVADIGSKRTQATILQALVDHAANFTTRGAFFIVKNENLVGWKLFGKDAASDDGRVREVRFPASTETVLSRAIGSLSTEAASNGQYEGDKVFLEALDYGQPERMYAIPLTARGRGVAVLYADTEDSGVTNVEALETLVNVASLTVELLAASQAAPAPVPQPVAEPAKETEAVEEPSTAEETVPEYSYEEVPVVTAAESRADEVEAVEEAEVQVEQEAQHLSANAVEEVQEYTGEVSLEPQPEVETVSEPVQEEVPVVERFHAEAEEATPEVDESAEEAPVVEETVAEFEFSSGVVHESSDPVAAEEVVETVPMVEAPVAVNGNGNGHRVQVAEQVVEVATVQPTTSRLSSRNVDLPIEVTDEERKLHNDARRFARLLVSEIKLYNEQQVTEGRRAGDLYDRLREAIDRSREMYEKRVQPAVASKFDYFHYELVNGLAEGVDARLGSNYPGATV